jgi:hypothetical protein
MCNEVEISRRRENLDGCVMNLNCHDVVTIWYIEGKIRVLSPFVNSGFTLYIDRNTKENDMSRPKSKSRKVATTIQILPDTLEKIWKYAEKYDLPKQVAIEALVLSGLKVSE